VELREKQPEKKADLLVRAGRYGLDGMPQTRPSGRWRRGDNGSAARGGIHKSLLGSGVVETSQLSWKGHVTIT
jgi:hypothetical protein